MFISRILKWNNLLLLTFYKCNIEENSSCHFKTTKTISVGKNYNLLLKEIDVEIAPIVGFEIGIEGTPRLNSPIVT